MASEPPIDVPQGIRVQDPASWRYMSRGLRRAWLVFGCGFALFLIAPSLIYFGAWPDWCWLGWVLGAVGLVCLLIAGLMVRRLWKDPVPLVKTSARRIILIGAGLIVITPLWYLFMVIPRL